MVTIFGDKATAIIFQGEFVHVLPLHLQALARRKLLMINAAQPIQNLHAPPGNRLEVLRSERSGQWSIRINSQWRICFYFVEGEALNVEIVDYH
ncbi:MAG: Toxin HigB [uncultured Paraburkholderia sp.]|nr:MAG: Toxin HigB [uncultured Paraburkholderia sp.]CAH2930478.1 MAG: Toxin HigB [uncultured Paraburkholderia sp.]